MPRRSLLLSLSFCFAALLWKSSALTALTLSDAQLPASQQKAGDAKGEKQDEQSIRLKTELINLRAVVTDKRGQVVTGLKREEFEVVENGKGQEVSFFSEVEVARSGGAAGAKAPEGAKAGGAATAASGSPAVPGRTVVLYIDTLHLSASSLMRAKQSLREFIDNRLTDQDLTAIVTSAGSLGVVEQFTRDRRVLRYAVDRLSARPMLRTSLFTPYLAGLVDRGVRDALEVAIAIYSAEERIPPNDPVIRQLVEVKARQILQEESYLRRSTLITLREVVRRLSDLPGQRLVMMLSDGFTLADQSGATDTLDLQSVTSRATASGVIIYTLDAKGLQPPAFFDASLGAIPNDTRIMSYSSAGERDLENGLNALARDTGGEPFFNTNDTVGSLGKVLDDNRAYYTLAYYPTGEETDKKFRKITIRIRNHPEYQVRAQHGYVLADLAKKAAEAEAKTPQQRFVNAILAPLPATGIGVTATAEYLEVPEDSAQVSLTIHVDGDSLSSREENGRYRFETEIVLMVFNSQGKRVEVKSETISGNLQPARWEIAKRNGLRYTKRLPLKPGLYQIRTGVREPGSERMGTAAAWVEVADLQKKRLAMSSLVLNDTLAIEPDNAKPASSEPIPPSKLVQGVRYYRRGQPLIYLFRLYNGEPGDADAEIQTEVLREEKPILTLPWKPAASRQIGRDAKGLVIGGQLAFSLVDPGIYELRISVKSTRTKRAIQRIIPFGIEP